LGIFGNQLTENSYLVSEGSSGWNGRSFLEVSKNASMKPKVLRAIIEIGFIIFLFYSNLFMGEFERSNGARKTLLLALEDIFTFTNFLIALLSSCIGYVVFEYLRRKF
jgi:hypothetical protein